MAIKKASLTLYIEHYTDDNGLEHIDINQTLTGGIPGTTENRTLDWQEREHSDGIFGPVVGRSKRVRLDEILKDYLKTGWTDGTKEDGAIDTYARSDTPKSGRSWTTEQVSGKFCGFTHVCNDAIRSGASKRLMVRRGTLGMFSF